jgi:general secretion pathway protein K
MSRVSTPTNPSQQRGAIAIITALAIVTMTTIAAVAMAHTLQLSIRRTGNILISDQGILYSLGSEAWSRGMLIRDLQDDDSKKYDGLDEDWAEELPTTPLEGGEVQAQTRDLQSRFNLNNLYLAKEASAEEKQEVKIQLAIFQRLLIALELDESIAQATADWLDENIEPQFPDGAEDDAYLSEERPYRTANHYMGNPTELRLVKGVTEEIYQKLNPYITALPETTTININTADPVVISALHVGLAKEGAEQLIDGREENPFKETGTFLETMKGLLGKNKVKSEEIEPVISVTSHFFELETIVRMDNDRQRLRSLLYKDDKGVTTLNRTFGVF